MRIANQTGVKALGCFNTDDRVKHIDIETELHDKYYRVFFNDGFCVAVEVTQAPSVTYTFVQL